MTTPQPAPQPPPPSKSLRSPLLNLFAILLSTLSFTWPALYNRFPLLFPDSMTYIEDGHLVARALFLHQLSDYYGMRSFFYSLGILPWHWDVDLWPVVVFQSLLTAYILWLVSRTLFATRLVARYLILCALLSALTTASWFTTLIMPDILGPLLYLSIYLLVFASETLSLRERLAVASIAWWGITAHATHLMLAVAAALILAAFLLLRRQSLELWKRLAQVVLVILLAAISQIALHAYLYGEPSLNGDRPPFLMARIIADGPGLRYLQSHCPQSNFTICNYLPRLSNDADDFVWGANGVWKNVDEPTAKRLRNEEVPFFLATLRAYPRAQISISARNFWQQLISFGFEPDASDWTLKEFDTTLPNQRSAYLKSRQAHNALVFDQQTPIQFWTVLASLAVIAVFAIRQFRRTPPRLLGLAIVILPIVVANALLTGAVSSLDDRYQGRVVWLLPLLAFILLLDFRQNWQRSTQ